MGPYGTGPMGPYGAHGPSPIWSHGPMWGIWCKDYTAILATAPPTAYRMHAYHKLGSVSTWSATKLVITTGYGYGYIHFVITYRIQSEGGRMACRPSAHLRKHLYIYIYIIYIYICVYVYMYSCVLHDSRRQNLALTRTIPTLIRINPALKRTNPAPMRTNPTLIRSNPTLIRP